MSSKALKLHQMKPKAQKQQIIHHQHIALNSSCESYRSIIARYNWNVRIAMAVMQAESGCHADAYNPSNSNGSNDAGLFQINSIHVSSGLITNQGRFDPEQNIRATYAIYSGGGWRAWSAYNNGAYLKYLK